MSRNIWVIEDAEKEVPVKVKIDDDETVGEFRSRMASEKGISMRDVDLGTDTKKLNDDNAVLAKHVKKGDTLYVLPRAKGGL